MRATQGDFFKSNPDYGPRRVSHGGSLRTGARKLSRPLQRSKPVHLVLKSSAAKGRLSLLGSKNQLFVKKILAERARQFLVRIHRVENMGNHLHVIASFKHRKSFQNFLRTVTALIARAVTGARKGKPFGKRFWDHLAFTRIVNGLRDLRQLYKYLKKNEFERELGPHVRKEIENLQRHRKRTHNLEY